MKKNLCFITLSSLFFCTNVSCEIPDPYVDGLNADTSNAGASVNSPPRLYASLSDEAALLKSNRVESFTLLNTADRQKHCEQHPGSATILMYHKFDEPYKSTSVTLDQFKQHMQFFKDRGHTVVPLEKVVAAIKGQIPFGEKWVAITIDDAYKSFLKVQPILESYQYPYTIFVNTKMVDKNSSLSMNWQDLQQVSESPLAEFGAHSHTHGHLVIDQNPQKRIQDIRLSVEKIYTNLGQLPRFFAYPFGEVSLRLIEELKSLNQIKGQPFQFEAAFATQSGPAGCSSDSFAIPRFPMNEKYGTMDYLFRAKMASRHLPLYDYFPRNKSVCVEEEIREIYFSTDPSLNLNQLNCFSKGESVPLEFSDGEVTVRLQEPIGYSVTNPREQRERLSCTLLHEGRYFWYGRELTVLKNSPDCSNYRR